MRMIDADALHAEISSWPESIMYKDWVQSAIASAPTLTQPNEPLTLDELQEMDGQPVWVEELNRWALVDLMYFRGDELIVVLFDDGDIKVRDVKLCNLHCYRRPAEGEEETK